MQHSEKGNWVYLALGIGIAASLFLFARSSMAVENPTPLALPWYINLAPAALGSIPAIKSFVLN